MSVKDKIKCAVYARDSTDQQGDTLTNQINQCKEYIKLLGEQYDYENVLEFKDHAVSGYYTSVFERAEMKRAIAAAKEKRFELLVFKEVSRVGRDKQENPAIIGMFEQYGIRVIAINDGYDTLNKSNITFDILSVLAEQESKKISSRVSSAKKQKALRGMWNGEAPIGYVVKDKRLKVDNETKHIVQLIFDLYVNRGMGTFKVAKYLNDRGYRSKNGRVFSRGTVTQILKNRVYIGDTIYGRRKNILKRKYDDTGKMTKKKMQVILPEQEWTIIEKTHEAIIDKELYWEARSILNKKKKQGAPRRAYHPLTGILFCGKCGAGMVCQKRSFSNKQYRYYICKTYHKYGRDACDQANVNADELERVIVNAIKERFKQIDINNIIAKSDRSNDIKQLEEEYKELNNRKERLKKDQLDIFKQRDFFTEETYQEQMITIKKQIEVSEQEMQLIENKIIAVKESDNNIANIKEIVNSFIKLEIEDTSRLRVLLHDLIKRITLTGDSLEIEYKYDIM